MITNSVASTIAPCHFDISGKSLISNTMRISLINSDLINTSNHLIADELVIVFFRIIN